MRLLHIITALHTGGAERMLAGLSHQWAGEHELHVAYLKPVHTLKASFHPGTHFHCTGLGLGTVRALRRLIRLIEPDVVHTHLGHADLLGLLATRGFAVQRFCTMHNAQFRPGVADQAFYTAYRFVLNRMVPDTRVVAISEAVARHTRLELGVGERRISILRNPLRIAEPHISRTEARARLGLADTDKLLCQVGRLELQKGHRVLLEALAFLASEGLRPRVYLLGEGKLETQLKALASQFGLGGQVRFVGLTDEVGLYLAASDALLLPSLFEGLGNVLAEGFAFGLPAIASDLEGPAEIVKPGKTGWLVEPASPQALAQAIAAFYALPLLELLTMRTACLAEAAQWPTEADYAQRLLSLYQG